ncbi:MAG TPA: HAMP domain-containing sensor histidine kinase [Sphingomicrobium sp.]
MTLLPRSLFGRLVVVQVAIAVVLAGALPLLISHWLISTTNSVVGHELDRSAARLRPIIGFGRQGWAFTSPPPPMFDAKTGIRSARLVDAAGKTWIDQGPHHSIPFSELPLGGDHAHRLWNGIDIAAYPILSNGHSAWLIVSSDRRRPESLVATVASTFLHRFLWIVPALILCSLILTLSFLAQGTRAIRRASKTADAIDGDRLEVRLSADELPLEVQPLVRAMNDALDRVQLSYAAQAEFAGNVAHELRNPLATVACRIEEISDPVLRQRMTASVAHAAHVIDQLMMLAKLGGEEPALASVDLRSVTLDALERSSPRIIADGRTIEFDDLAEGGALVIDANQALTQLSLDNLIDNAQRHTPVGTHIRVGLAAGPRIYVEDDGPGIATPDRDRVSARNWRGHRSDGAGLGLSIVSKAMRAQEGWLEICEGANGARLALNFFPEPV